VIGVEVLDQHIGVAGIVGQTREKILERFEAAGGGAETYDGTRRGMSADVGLIGREQPFGALKLFKGHAAEHSQ
jgi:hypothetical protein